MRKGSEVGPGNESCEKTEESGREMNKKAMSEYKTEEVLIGIKGLHAVKDSPEDDIEVVFPGSLRKLGDTWYLRYTEPVEGFEGEIRSLIKMRNRYLEVSKRGLTSTNMIFEEGKKNVTWYDTPLGSVLLGISATSVQVNLQKNSIEAQAAYALDVNDQHQADCHISISVTPREGSRIGTVQ